MVGRRAQRLGRCYTKLNLAKLSTGHAAIHTLTLGWLGAWKLKADGTHAQPLTALPPLGGSGGGGSGGRLLPWRSPLS